MYNQVHVFRDYGGTGKNFHARAKLQYTVQNSK